MSVLSRVVNSFLNLLNLFVHGSYGVDINLDSSGPQGYKLLEYKPGQPLPETLVLPSEASKAT